MPNIYTYDCKACGETYCEIKTKIKTRKPFMCTCDVEIPIWKYAGATSTEIDCGD